MSLHEYRESQNIEAENYPFYALIMAAMRQADTVNRDRLKMVYPALYSELKQRYNAPGGSLSSD